MRSWLTTLFILMMAIAPAPAARAEAPVVDTLAAPTYLIPAKCSAPSTDAHWHIETEYPISYDGPEYWHHRAITATESLTVPDWVEQIHYSLYGVRQTPARPGQTIMFTEATGFCLTNSPTQFSARLSNQRVTEHKWFMGFIERSTEISTTVFVTVTLSTNMEFPCLCGEPVRTDTYRLPAGDEFHNFDIVATDMGPGLVTFDFLEVETGKRLKYAFDVSVVSNYYLTTILR